MLMIKSTVAIQPLVASHQQNNLITDRCDIEGDEVYKIDRNASHLSDEWKQDAIRYRFFNPAKPAHMNE